MRNRYRRLGFKTTGRRSGDIGTRGGALSEEVQIGQTPASGLWFLYERPGSPPTEQQGLVVVAELHDIVNQILHTSDIVGQ